MFLYRHSGKAYDVDEVVQQLGLTCPAAEKCLGDLKRNGLIHVRDQQQGLYQAIPDNDQQAQLIQNLGQVYADRRVTIINLIFSRHLDRIRAFADSFKLNKSDDDG